MDTSTPTLDEPRWRVEETTEKDWAPPGRPEETGYPDSPTSHDCTGEGDGIDMTATADVDPPELPDADFPFADIPPAALDVDDAGAFHRPPPPVDEPEFDVDGYRYGA